MPQSRSVFARNPRRVKVPNPSERDRERSRGKERRRILGVREDDARRSKTARVARARFEPYLQSKCRYPPPACKHASPVCMHTRCVYVCTHRQAPPHGFESSARARLRRSIYRHGVLFLTSLSSPAGLYGHSLRRFRARSLTSPTPSSFPAFRPIVYVRRNLVVVAIVVVVDFLVSMLTHSASRAVE